MTPQVSIAHYRLTTKIGQGGMGEVWRATDTKLGREVAIKILPESFADDADRVARFKRESQVLASLNHPNIAAIYGVEEHALVLELVEGPTLAERISQGPVPVDEAIAIATQIADALDAAHEKGIIHRDLKPSNIKLTPEGKVKVLDFGLAKALAGDVTQADPLTSPTLTIAGTRDTTIMGTAAYMSPEQARGRPVDRRVDIWAFGCVLYEMLTGRQAFAGETVSDTLAAVLRAEPDWTAFPTSVPERLQYLTRRCLTKDIKTRLRDMGEARVIISEVTSGATAVQPAGRSTHARLQVFLAWTLAGLMTLSTAIAVWVLLQRRQPFRPNIRASITLPPGDRLVSFGFQPMMALSPDGSQIVYSALRGPRRQLFVRRMDQLEAAPIDGTDDGDGPFFSPDGQWIGFFAEGKMKKIPVSGGVAATLADAVAPRGASWGEDGSIVFAMSLAGGLARVSAEGGVPQRLTTAEARRETSHRWPQFLPGGKAIIYTSAMPGSIEASRVCLFRLDTGEQRTLIEGATYGRYIPSGHLVFARAGELLAVRFDLTRLDVAGKQNPILQGVLINSANGAYFTFSNTGSLVYVPGNVMTTPRAILWVDRKGVATQIGRTNTHAYWPRVSPDGRRFAISVLDRAGVDIWIAEPGRDNFTRFTFQPGVDAYPVWTPDGRRLIFSSNRAGLNNLYWKSADGSGPEERLTESPNFQLPGSVSRDGKWLAFYEESASSSFDIWILPLQGERKPKPFVQTPYWEGEPSFSPDGRWLAYVSMETGQAEVYVQPFPEGISRGKWLISANGGREPVWVRATDASFSIAREIS